MMKWPFKVIDLDLAYQAEKQQVLDLLFDKKIFPVDVYPIRGSNTLSMLVEMQNIPAAQGAIDQLDNIDFLGRKIRVTENVEQHKFI
jgi:hypothetical protein